MPSLIEKLKGISLLAVTYLAQLETRSFNVKRSILSAAIGAGVIVLSVTMLPLAPVSAQDSGASGSSNAGNSSGGNTTTGSSAAPGSSTSDPSASPSAAATGDTSNTNEGPSNLGLVGLLGLFGLIPLFRRPAGPSAVGINRTEPLQTDSQATSDHLHQGLNQVGTGSRNLVDEIKTNVSDFQERRAQEKEIQNIKNALGRPSKRVILDRQDNVILNVGDLITNQAVEHAKSADMLDVLFASVDEREPEIANEAHSAPVTGEASLEEREQGNNINHRR